MSCAMEILRQAMQVIVALGLLNVWLARSGKSTRYRGGDAQSMREEFAAYGLPVAMMYVVGGLKLIIAVALLAGIWLHVLVVPAAAVLILLMIGAFMMTGGFVETVALWLKCAFAMRTGAPLGK